MACKLCQRLEEPGDERDLHCVLNKDASLSSGSTSEHLAALELITSARPCTALNIYRSLLLNPFYYSVHVFDYCYRIKYIIRIKTDIVLQE